MKMTISTPRSQALDPPLGVGLFIWQILCHKHNSMKVSTNSKHNWLAPCCLTIRDSTRHIPAGAQWGNAPKMKNIACFCPPPQQNQKPGDLCNKMRLLPIQSACTGRFCPLIMTSCYVVGFNKAAVCKELVIK